MILYIDSTDFNKVTFALSQMLSRTRSGTQRNKDMDSRLRGNDKKKVLKKSYKINPHKSHETLGFLDKFLKEKKIKHDEIKKIIVNKGPGSYTGVRVGVTIAQALGFVWNIPVRAVGKDKFKII
ncbi:MAG: hypothetical protein NTX98_03225 [Candidatus Doudnabacteria bacterium]|nr:hypothetical protein [Candidatus Doudnabacteria bacterium]